MCVYLNKSQQLYIPTSTYCFLTYGTKIKKNYILKFSLESHYFTKIPKCSFSYFLISSLTIHNFGAWGT